METLVKLPQRWNERWDLDEEIRYSATFEEFWETMAECDYKVEYHNGQIVSFMSYATDPHELLVGKILGIFYQLFDEHSNHFIYPSNRPVITPGQNVYNPDASMVIGKTKFFQYARGRNAMTNPSLIVEVLSKSTKEYDLNEKLPVYKQIPSVQQILYIDSLRMHVSSWLRTEVENQWLNKDFFNENEIFSVLGAEISMKDLYRKVTFEQSA